MDSLSAAPVGGGAEEPALGESRWPPAAALLVCVVLNISLRIWLPGEGSPACPG